MVVKDGIWKPSYYYNTNGLATEYRTLCLSLGLPSLMAKDVTKNESKQAIKTKIREECIKRMQEGSKSKDRVDLERRGMRVSEVMGRVIFWRRMTQKMTQKTDTVT